MPESCCHKTLKNILSIYTVKLAYIEVQGPKKILDIHVVRINRSYINNIYQIINEMII